MPSASSCRTHVHEAVPAREQFAEQLPQQAPPLLHALHLIATEARLNPTDL